MKSVRQRWGRGHEQWGSNFVTENHQYCLMSHLENLDDIVMIHIEFNNLAPPPSPPEKLCLYSEP